MLKLIYDKCLIGQLFEKARDRRYPAQTITDADYADDIALLASTTAQAESLLHSLENTADGIDLHVNVLCFDLLTRPKMPFKVMHRKEVTHSNGSYERKSRGRKLADEMGRCKKKIPLYSHRLTHRKRVASELHDSYSRSMTITQAIPKIVEVTHPDRQISEEIAEACPYHRVGV